MWEYRFDLILIALGAALLVLGWWVLIHNSDKRIFERIRLGFLPPGVSKDEAEASKAFHLAFLGIWMKVVGGILLIAGILGFFGFGR